MDTARHFELVAAFRDGEGARSALHTLTSRGLPESRARVVEPGDPDPIRVGEMRAEMQEEVVHSFAGPSIGLFTPSQAKGALAGVLTFATVGLVLGLIVGWLWSMAGESALSRPGRIAVAAVAFLVGSSTIGFLVGGALKPRADAQERPTRMLDQGRLAGERDTLVAVHIEDEREAATVQRLLEEAGASRVDSLDAEGWPLPPQSEHPRPADPPGWWREEESPNG